MSIVQGARQWFVDFLKNNLNYLDSNLIVEKNIDKSVIELLIVENNSSEFFPLAIVEFKNLNSSIENTEQQVEKYRELIGKRNLPCFLIHG